MRRAARTRIALVAALCAVHLLAGAWLTPRGHLSIDECTYHGMSRSTASGTLAFWNGYEEFPSQELVWPTLVPHAGALYPVTPPFYAWVAAPFYALLGFAGLFWVNALAFLAALWLTGRLAWRLFGDARLAWTAVGVLACASYFWEYSQAAWPHALSTLAVLAGVTLGWQALRAEREAAAFRAAALAGLLLGAGMGVRLDVALAVPAVLLPFLFAPPRRSLAGLGVALGLLAPLVLLGFINHSKFGIASPLTYGTQASSAGDWTRYLPVAALGLAGTLAAWVLQQPALARWRGRNRAALAAGAAAVLALALALPELRELLLRLGRGVATLLVDLRLLREDIVRPALSRSAGDGLVYFGHLKKAWLQSLPYLGLLVLPVCAALRGHADRGRLALLALVPATYLAAFGSFAWDGGMSLNLRYLTPALPAVAILTAWTLREMGAAKQRPALGVGAWCAAALFLWLARTRSASPDAMELFVLDAPLVLAALCLLAVGALAARGAAPLRALACGAAGAGLAWACLVAFAYDYPAVRWLRGYHHELSQLAGGVMERDAILFTTHPDPFCGLLDDGRVRIALPARDRQHDLRRLADFHLAASRAVYAALPRSAWRALERSGRLEGLAQETLAVHPVFEIRRLRD